MVLGVWEILPPARVGIGFDPFPSQGAMMARVTTDVIVEHSDGVTTIQHTLWPAGRIITVAEAVAEGLPAQAYEAAG